MLEKVLNLGSRPCFYTLPHPLNARHQKLFCCTLDFLHLNTNMRNFLKRQTKIWNRETLLFSSFFSSDNKTNSTSCIISNSRFFLNNRWLTFYHITNSFNYQNNFLRKSNFNFRLTNWEEPGQLATPVLLESHENKNPLFFVLLKGKKGVS